MKRKQLGAYILLGLFVATTYAVYRSPDDPHVQPSYEDAIREARHFVMDMITGAGEPYWKDYMLDGAKAKYETTDFGAVMYRLDEVMEKEKWSALPPSSIEDIDLLAFRERRSVRCSHFWV